MTKNIYNAQYSNVMFKCRVNEKYFLYFKALIFKFFL